jgi:hypothetical protein
MSLSVPQFLVSWFTFSLRETQYALLLLNGAHESKKETRARWKKPINIGGGSQGILRDSL